MAFDFVGPMVRRSQATNAVTLVEVSTLWKGDLAAMALTVVHLMLESRELLDVEIGERMGRERMAEGGTLSRQHSEDAVVS